MVARLEVGLQVAGARVGFPEGGVGDRDVAGAAPRAPPVGDAHHVRRAPDVTCQAECMGKFHNWSAFWKRLCTKRWLLGRCRDSFSDAPLLPISGLFKAAQIRPTPQVTYRSPSRRSGRSACDRSWRCA